MKSLNKLKLYKIAFVSASSHAYSLNYTVEDSDTAEATKLTVADFTKSVDNVLTLNDSGLGKVMGLNFDSAPAEKTITINFIFRYHIIFNCLHKKLVDII